MQDEYTFTCRDCGVSYSDKENVISEFDNGTCLNCFYITKSNMPMTEKQASMICWQLKGDEASSKLLPSTIESIRSKAISQTMSTYEASDIIEYLKELNDWTSDAHEAIYPNIVKKLNEMALR